MQVPVDILHWLLAALPILVLAFLLVQLRWSATQAGSAGVLIATLVALFFFRAPLDTLAVAGAKGVWDAIFILLVIWPALLLHEVMDQAGGYESLRQGLTRMSRNELFDVIAIGWVFASFLQGIAGFGTPIAIAAPLMVAIGVRPVYAVVIPIISHIWAKFFGTLGSGWIATEQVVDLGASMMNTAAWQSGLLMSIQAVLGGFTVVWMYGRWPALRHAWPLVLIIALIQGIGQTVVAGMNPPLAAFIPATVALIALYPLSRWPRFSEPAEEIVDRPAMREGYSEDLNDKKPSMNQGMSYFPYIFLTLVALATSIIEPVKNALEGFTIGFSFPQVTTGYAVTNEAATPYSSLSPLTHPGASLLFAALVTWGLYRARGYYKAWAAETGKKQKGVLRALFESGVPASVPILAFLVMAGVMNHSGQNETLALGIVALAPAYVFAFLSNGIGILGAFTTSSATSSNVLFSDLQVTVAELNDLPPESILAAQSAGANTGNAIAPANAVMGASTTGITGQEGEIIRKALPWTIATFILTGAGTLLLLWFA